MTGCFNGLVCHFWKLIVDGKVASGLFIVNVSIEVQIGGNHEVVIAIIGCRVGYFVGFPKNSWTRL